MDTTTKELGSAHQFPYQTAPQEINFFLYPPLKPSSMPAMDELVKNIGLDKAIAPSHQFAIYVSIPYCQIKCHSCHCFKEHLSSHKDKEIYIKDYLECLYQQIRAYANTKRFQSAKCGAIYIGGGTGSLLSAEQVDHFIRTMYELFPMTEDVEINLEGNPTDFTLEYLQQVKASGVNRISIGYQSAIDSVLIALNTLHRYEVGIQSVKDALSMGFHAVNVDLLYNVPGQSEEQWHEDVKYLIAMKPQSIGAGDYIVFSGSAADKLIKRGKLQSQQDHHTTYEWYLWATEELNKANYFEQVRGIFARPGHEQKYLNLSCQKNYDLVGFGAGSFNFIDRHQFRITKNVDLYKQQIRNGYFIPIDQMSERATDRNLMERYIILNLFFSKLDRDEFKQRFNIDPVTAYPDIFSKLKQHELIKIDDNITLTTLGREWRRNVYYEFHNPIFKE